MALWSNTDANASKPKYLSDNLRNDQSVSDLDNVLGIDVTEAKVAANIAKGITTPGWVDYKTYTDSQGNTRNKVEVLVAMSSLTGDNDTIAPEITITVQPTAQAAVEGEAATFGVTATRTGTGTLTYLWQVSIDDGETWNTASGAPATNSTFVIDPTALEMDGHQYRVVVSLTGAQSVTSNAVALTVTAGV